eukprot:14989445-Alexandrium_andersonii.AAC.1
MMRENILNIEWEAVRARVRELSPAHATAVLKTWCGGWTTTRRLHDGAAGCLLGCEGGADCMAHYIACQ